MTQPQREGKDEWPIQRMEGLASLAQAQMGGPGVACSPVDNVLMVEVFQAAQDLCRVE